MRENGSKLGEWREVEMRGRSRVEERKEGARFGEEKR